MVTGHVFIATSLDGFIARPDHGLDWLMKFDGGDTDATGYDGFMASVDGLIMGRGTFQTVSSFEPWPYAKPVVVVSCTLGADAVPAALRDNVTISSAEPAALMEEMGRKGWRRAYIDGGQVIQSYLRAGLIADMTITVAPILIGEGRRLFGPTDADIDLELVDLKRPASTGFAQMRYRVVRDGDGV